MIAIFSWSHVSHYTCALTLFIGFSWLCFHELDKCLNDLECLVPCGFHVFHEKLFCFIPCLKDFVLVNKFFHLTSSYSSYGSDFQTNYTFNLFLKTPTIDGRMDGRSCSCMLYNKNHFKLEHDWVVGNMRYTLILLLFQLISLNSFNWYQFWSFLYTYICLYVCMFFNSNSINFDWY